MRPRVFLLYEHDVAFRPHASSYLRLMRPLSHPQISKLVNVEMNLRYQQEDADLVIFDRFWRPDVNREYVERAIRAACRAGSKILYAVDDDLLNLPPRRTKVGSSWVEWPTEDHREAMACLLEAADSVWVTTEPLRRTYESLNPRIMVLPNYLDERLLSRAIPFVAEPARRSKVIGYMGTPTHDSDLRMIIPALKEVCHRRSGEIAIEIVGGIADVTTANLLSDLPVRYLSPLPTDHEYPYFMMWFTRSMRWDIAIAPLVDNSFNRCKSDIKYLDYAAIGAAPVCSRVPAYEWTVAHGKTGMLVENEDEAWVKVLEELLDDEDLRYEIATGAVDYLTTQRTLSSRASDWSSALMSALADLD